MATETQRELEATEADRERLNWLLVSAIRAHIDDRRDDLYLPVIVIPRRAYLTRKSFRAAIDKARAAEEVTHAK